MQDEYDNYAEEEYTIPMKLIQNESQWLESDPVKLMIISLESVVKVLREEM
jgi:hypothetical protein